MTKYKNFEKIQHDFTVNYILNNMNESKNEIENEED